MSYLLEVDKFLGWGGMCLWVLREPVGVTTVTV